MKIEDHIFYAVEAGEKKEIEIALSHACIAIDVSSQKYFKSNKSIRDNYIKFIRKYYWILEPMMGGGVNLDDTKWENISVPKLNGEEESKKDIAAIIYHDFRCTQVHGNEIHPLYKLSPHNTDATSHCHTDGTSHYHIVNGQLQLPERTIWGLIAICVFAEINKDISTQTEHFLYLGANRGVNRFVISDWWGLENLFRPIAEKYNPKRATLEFGVLKS